MTGIQAVAASTATTVLDLAYSYAQSSHNNGNITAQTNNVDTGRTQSYTYDPLNRLLTAESSAMSGGDCWGQGFGNTSGLAADGLANFFYATATKCTAPAPNFTMSGSDSNRFSGTGISYDSDGNNTADGSHSYTFDAENRIASVDGTYCYIYNAIGLRVAKAHVASGYTCSDTSPHAPIMDMGYWRNIAGNTIAETDSSGSTSNASYNEYIFFGGRRIARSNPNSGTVNYYFVDHLGSTRVMTSASGSVCFKMEYYPYGQEQPNSTTTCNTSYKFTGYERDAETGNDYAFARHYNPRLGRFMSGDPLGSSADASDPQTLNRYTYVNDNPVNLTDPSGMYMVIPPYKPDPWMGTNMISFGGEPGMCLSDSYFDGSPSGPNTCSGGVQLSFAGGAGLEYGPGPSEPQPPPRAKRLQPIDKKNCPTVPQHPQGADVNGNIALVEAHVAAASYDLGSADAPSAMDSVMVWWTLMVTPTIGPWDYKTQGSKYDDFGNFNYGATGAALGLNLNTLQNGASVFKGVYTLGRVYPNQTEKQQMIQKGFQYYQNGCN